MSVEPLYREFEDVAVVAARLHQEIERRAELERQLSRLTERVDILSDILTGLTGSLGRLAALQERHVQRTHEYALSELRELRRAAGGTA